MHALLLLLPFLAHAAIDPVVDAADRRLPESAALSAASISKMPKRRVLAARAFGQIMSPAGIAPLTRLAGDPMPFVREEALFALGQLGWVKEAASGHEDAIRSELLKHLSDKRISVRVAAAEALGKIGGEKAFELLTPAFYSGDSLLRAAAVTAFFRSRMILKLRDPTHPPASLSDGERSRLLALASSKNAPERAAVAYFFSRNAEPLAEETMARLARDPDATVRLFAVTALGKMKAQNSRASLEAALKDPEYSVRVAGVNAWSTGTSLGDQTRALMADKSFHVRAAAAATLGADQSDLLLLALEHDESNTVKAEALKALAKTKGEKLLPFLEEQLKSPLWQIREAAAQASEPLSPDAKEKFLSAALLKETDRLVRAALLEPYLALPGSSPFAQLKRSLDSSELSERATAVGALAARKEDEIAELA
ncbi:MAG: HEAT repeat domain-containing protein, partial [Bdellovibrionota bacterium]